MFNYIKGKLAGITENSIIVENGGIGYEIFVPATDTGSLWQTGQEVKVYTYLHVREDLVQLFGFMDKDTLDLFKMLITVSGIGPKGALGILGATGADSLRFAVLADDAKTIAKAPGIGLKTAGRLILELKDKLKVKEVAEGEFKVKEVQKQHLHVVRKGQRLAAVTCRWFLMLLRHWPPLDIRLLKH